MVSAQDNRVLFDQLTEQVWDECESARLGGLFTSCSIGVVFADKKSFGHILRVNCGQAADQLSISSDPVCYDLASLTKIIVTVPCVLLLAARGTLDLAAPLGAYWPAAAESDKAALSIRDLLQHTSGLPAHREFYKAVLTLPEGERKKRLQEMVLAEAVNSSPGNSTEYSDLGFLILGWLVEELTGLCLARFWEQNIALPFGFDKQLFFPPAQKRDRHYVPTGFCPWSGKLLLGEVNDDNCRCLGGVAGHAGLFGTLEGMLTYSFALLQLLQATRSDHWQEGSHLWHKLLVKQERQGRYVYGFDTPDAVNSSSGRYFSATSIGHLGFTGTSCWLDPQQQVGVVVLTNRSYCSSDLAGIRKFRPSIHDLIMANIKRLRKMRSL